MKKSKNHYNGINSFDMMVTYTDMSGTAPRTDPESHIHNECEIYINISGDASFIVENRIYPVLPGSIIITKP